MNEHINIHILVYQGFNFNSVYILYQNDFINIKVRSSYSYIKATCSNFNLKPIRLNGPESDKIQYGNDDKSTMKRPNGKLIN